MKNLMKLTTLIIFAGIVLINPARAEKPDKNIEKRNDLLQPGCFIQIPGPNPILTPGTGDQWDSGYIETSDAFKDFGTYYLYYHGSGGGKGYQIGVATSQHPLGPFKKYEGNPIMKTGPEGSWNDEHVACAMILKEGVDRYYMWYSVKSSELNLKREQHHSIFSVGLATADNPLGPWKEYEGNPIMEDFGYVGGVVKVKGKYYLYAEWPIGDTGDDYGPMSVAIADKPEGPWKIWPDNPVMKAGEWGEWDDGGISEAEVIYWAGVFHTFYGGTKLYEPRITSRESIGYAYSFDGLNFIKYGLNPVAGRNANPNAASFSEVHAVFEPPFVYLYHTLRYKQPRHEADKKTWPLVEDIGVQVLVLQKHFILDMPVLNLDELGAGESTTLMQCPPVSLAMAEREVLTVEGNYTEKAAKGLIIQLKSSYDGLSYDTTDLFTFEHDFQPGQLVRQSYEINTNARFVKVLLKNPDKGHGVKDLNVIVTLKN